MNCNYCNQLLPGEYLLFEGKAYHQHCLIKKENLICIACGEPLIESYITDPWGNKAHTHHQIPHCHVCGQFCACFHHKRHFHHADGRIICQDCERTAIRNTRDISRYVEYVSVILRRTGFSIDSSKVHIELTDLVTLSTLSSSDTCSGLAKISRHRNGRSSTTSSTIYILDHLPGIYFMGVLAHEILHVWAAQLNLNLGDYEEAVCNLGTTLIYNLHKKDRLARLLNDQMKTDEHPLYGIKYMELKNRLKKVGWRKLIREAKQYRDNGR